MTALRIFATAKPSLIGARVLPMSREDESFWAILAQRRASRALPVRDETLQAARGPEALARGPAKQEAPNPGIPHPFGKEER